MSVEVETQPSTMPYYRDRRSWLLFNILRTNTDRLPRLHGLLLDKLLWCERCDRVLPEEELEVHHPNGDGANGECQGGWQRLYSHENDFEEGKELQVLCTECHCAVDPHRRQLRR